MALTAENDAAKEKDSLNAKIEICKRAMLSLYKDRAGGVVSKEEYSELKSALRSEMSAYTERIRELSEKITAASDQSYLSGLLSSIINFSGVGRADLLMLVDRVNIGHNKEIEIIFKFEEPKSGSEL